MSNPDSEYTRRTYIKGAAAASAAGMAGLAGCIGGGGGSGGNGSGGNASGGGGGGGGSMTVLHGWTGGDGARAVESLIEGFRETHPDVSADFRPIGGGGNTNLDTTIATRAQNGNLPSSWADWPGKNLVQFTSAGLLSDIGDSVWTDEFRSAFSEEAQTYSQVGESAGSIGEGPYVAVPIGSHRMNDLFYNVNVIEEAGVDPASLSTPNDLVGALQQVEQNTDAVGMAQAHQAAFTTLQLWEVVMQGQSGYQAFMDFINGNGSADAVRSAFETIQQYSEYYNSDVSSISFTTANQMFMNDEAGFVQNGNWAAGAFRNQDGFEYGQDWDHVSFPGTGNMYGMHLDSFPMPADVGAPEATQTFLSYVGSPEGQARFNQYKGSIPPRTDVDTEPFGPYLTETISEYDEAEYRPPTIAHGLALVPDVMSEVEGVIVDTFRGAGDIDAATQQMLDAVSGSN